MSRTDKDMPYWVTAEWYKPYHGCGWYRTSYWNDDFTAREIKWVYRGDCDLPENPTRSSNRPRRVITRLCSWEAEWPPQRYYQTRGRRCKKEWRRFEFNGPQRRAERDAARKVIQGDWEAEFPDGRTRHSVLWDMW